MKGYFAFAASQTREGQRLIRKFRLGEIAQHSIILIEQGDVYHKSTAALRIARRLGRAWPLFFVFIILPRNLRDLLYDLIARSRYRLFGMSDHCFMPDPEFENRFLQDE